MEVSFAVQLLRAFLVGGMICLVGQLLLDIASLTPAHTLSLMVTAGSVLSVCGVYPALAEYAGCGATLPISSFGNVMVEGARHGAAAGGFWGILGGVLAEVSTGITAAIVCGLAAALIFRPRS